MLRNIVLSAAALWSAPALSLYTHYAKKCVYGKNLIRYSDKTIPECEQLCDDNERCTAFEYGVAYGGSKGNYKPRDCQLQYSSDAGSCDGASYNLDLHVRVDYQHFEKSCVNGRNIKLFKYKSVRECQNLCDENDACVAIEYGVAYGGGGRYKARDCQLQSSVNRLNCNGAHHNLDLYVKPQPFVRFPVGCVTGNNIKKYYSQTVQSCQGLCDLRDDCKAVEYGTKSRECGLNSSADYRNCDGGYHKLDLYAKKSALPSSFDTDTYHQYARSCVSGGNIKLYQDKSVQECKDLCDARSDCKAIEYGVAYGGKGRYKARDCQLQSFSRRVGCDGSYHNLDLYVKSTYEHFAKSCVNGKNLKLYKNKSILECQNLCDARDDCKAIEYGVAYGGDGKYHPADCQLQSDANRSGCNGAHHNLDLYVKTSDPLPSVAPSPMPTPAPVTPRPTPHPTPAPTPNPSPRPTKAPTPKPTRAPVAPPQRYQQFERSCVNGKNIVLYRNKSVDMCKALCNAHAGCKAFEYGVAYGGPGKYRAGDCQLQSSSDRRNCNGSHFNLDLYIPVKFTRYPRSCVNGHNIRLIEYVSEETCKDLCARFNSCVAFEYGMNYGGKGRYKYRDCQLQSSANRSGCNGSYHNLDLYVLTFGKETESSSHRRLLALEDSSHEA